MCKNAFFWVARLKSIHFSSLPFSLFLILLSNNLKAGREHLTSIFPQYSQYLIAEAFFCKERYVSRKTILENNWQIFMIHAGKVGITTCSFEHLHLQLWSVLSTLRIPRLCRNADIQQPKPFSWLGWSMPSELCGIKLQDLWLNLPPQKPQLSTSVAELLTPHYLPCSLQQKKLILWCFGIE